MSETSFAVTVEQISPVKTKLSFDIPWEEVRKGLDDVYRQVGKKAKIRGFRPGKIPRHVLEMYYKESAEEETAANLINKYFMEAVKGKGIEPVDQPDIDRQSIEADRNFTFTATVEVEPLIEPRDYTGLELTRVEPEVTQEDMDAKIEELRNIFSTLEDCQEDRGTREGDFVEMDFEGTVEGKPVRDMKSENYFYEIGSKRFVPGFEEHLLDMRKGESKQFELTLPEDYRAKDLAGKEALFSVSLKNIKVKKLPAVDEEFVKNFDHYETLDALMEGVRKSLLEEKQARSDQDFRNQIIDKLLESNEFEAPPSFVERQILYMMSDMRQRMISSGMNPEQATDFSLEFHDRFKDEATKTVKTILLLNRIGKKESITVEQADVEAKIREMAERTGQEYEAAKRSLEQNRMIGNLEADLLNEKILSFVKEKSTITLVKEEEMENRETGL
ncbi:MAG: trigger factor [Deltaproteobacteria bacterium]|nr:trigger factor [Deltaproteobacteria bacterium]